MAKVFISYARADEATAERVAAALESAGHEPWWDRNLPAHRSFSDVIEEELERCEAALILWSKDSSASEWVRAEADHSRTAHKLVQASLDDSIPPLPFNQFHSESLKGFKGEADHHGFRKLLGSIEAVAKGEGGIKRAVRTTSTKSNRKSMGLVALALAALAAIAAYFFLGADGGDDGTTTLAVLPFETSDADNEALADGIWEDTRTALSSNPQLKVIGRQTIEALSINEMDPAAYRDAIDADYLLEADLRIVGNDLRMTVELVDADSGTLEWSERFDRSLDDVFALQLELASEIEGRVRGRLADNSGRLPENIATSGQNYRRFSEARAIIHSRAYHRFGEAAQLLGEVLNDDPNYAPAWAAKAVLGSLGGQSLGDDYTTERAESYARRAIELAPNLAAGHTALGFILGRDPAAEEALNEAARLDPGDPQVFNWIGNLKIEQGKFHDAKNAYAKAVDIDLFFEPGVSNLAALYLAHGDDAALEDLRQQLRRAGADDVKFSMEFRLLAELSKLAELTMLAIQRVDQRGHQADQLVQAFRAFGILTLEGDEALKNAGDLPSPIAFLAQDPREFLDQAESNLVAIPINAYPITSAFLVSAAKEGRSDLIVRWFDTIQAAPETSYEEAYPLNVLSAVPGLVVALREMGRNADAAKLLQYASSHIHDGSPADEPSVSGLISRARILATMGREDDVMELLEAAKGRGWVPLQPFLLC